MDDKYETFAPVVDLDVILKKFADEYEAKDGRTIIDREWFVDMKKGKVCFVLTTKKSE